jgi:transcriptional regulator of acetoin/glycerol metabolism
MMHTRSPKMVARARAEYFARGADSGAVKPEIALAWRRAASMGLHPESQPQPRYATSRRAASLVAAAEPAIESLRDHIPGRAAVLLLDKDGVIVGRWYGGASIDRILDDAAVRPGRVFDESAAGTTGLGTPLEVRRPVAVEGPEHVLSSLDGLTAAGAPILHPSRGTVEGVVDIVGVLGLDIALATPLVVGIAQEIAKRLVSGHAAADRMLLDAFPVAERRGHRRPMLAINDRIIIGNVPGNAIGVSDHSAVWTLVQSALAAGQTAVDLPTTTATWRDVRLTPVGRQGTLEGAIMHLHASRTEPGTASLHQGAHVRSSALLGVSREAEREAVDQALIATGGNKRAAADLLQISRATLYRKLSSPPRALSHK